MKKKIKDNKKYIIVELIPTAISPDKGLLAQISAIKLEGLKLIDRFDYRLDFKYIDNPYVLRMIDYDKDKFNYLDSSSELVNKFREWCGSLDLFIIDNLYTNNYLKDFKNKKVNIFSYLDIDNDDQAIDKMIEKYKLEKSNYIVDLLYEALIYESNNR